MREIHGKSYVITGIIVMIGILGGFLLAFLTEGPKQVIALKEKEIDISIDVKEFFTELECKQWLYYREEKEETCRIRFNIRYQEISLFFCRY